MKRIILISLLMASVGWGAAITDESELQTNWELGGSHTISAGTYTLTSDLTPPTEGLILIPQRF